MLPVCYVCQIGQVVIRQYTLNDDQSYERCNQEQRYCGCYALYSSAIDLNCYSSESDGQKIEKKYDQPQPHYDIFHQAERNMYQTPYSPYESNDKVRDNKAEREMVCPAGLAIVQKAIYREARHNKNGQGNSQSKPDKILQPQLPGPKP